MTVTMTAWVTTGPCAHSEGPGQKLSPPPHALPPLSTPPPTLHPLPSAVLTGSFTNSCRPSPRRRSCRYSVASRCRRQLFSRPWRAEGTQWAGRGRAGWDASFGGEAGRNWLSPEVGGQLQTIEGLLVPLLAWTLIPIETP